jgi:thermitase
MAIIYMGLSRVTAPFCFGDRKMLYKRDILIFFCVVAIFVAVAVPVSGMSRKPPEPAYVPGQVVVKFQEGVSRERIEQIVKAENGTIEKVLARSGLHLVYIERDRDVMGAVTNFGAYPEVQHAEPNFKAEPLEGR